MRLLPVIPFVVANSGAFPAFTDPIAARRPDRRADALSHVPFPGVPGVFSATRAPERKTLAS
jgi:hypothetical protein